MSTVWVVTRGEDSEGGTVLGVATTADGGKAIAQADAPKPMDWAWMRSHPVDCWFARHPAYSIDYYEVAPWEVVGGE